MKSETKKIILGIIGIIIVAVLGTVFVNLGMDWFDSLIRPSNWINEIIIPIMWTIIYILFGIYIVMAVKSNQLNNKIIFLLILNGILNILWCLVFFTLENLLGGVVVIVLNAIFAVVLVQEILNEQKRFYYTLVLYPIWVAVATALNLSLWILN